VRPGGLGMVRQVFDGWANWAKRAKWAKTILNTEILLHNSKFHLAQKVHFR
jgi:hypothetical protein